MVEKQMVKKQPSKRKDLIGICPNCRRVQNFSKIGYTSRQVEGHPDLEDIGIQCPLCQHWTNSHYLNGELRVIQQQLKNLGKRATRQQRRQYTIKFKKFQKKIRKVLNAL